ncbi:hypothetical protein [Geobacter sp. DSM 9736]|uniref:spermine/spermidine synthase domain-containing protein n=1 Tax=Geobacter sp. DSM 9736 TaxID=1277350 RepID=UPI000B5011CC|nr:hypothetical protein [Geobacter sp. DSM 9736]SNB47161.1 Spermine/spermidine synthase [Geobacter sp. DSM 9736]
MIAWKLLDSARIPGGNTDLHFYKRGGEYSIRINGNELMNSRAHASEDALAKYACARTGNRLSRRILIGGLGMGFTTAAALQQLDGESRVVVAELVPSVVEWNRRFLGELNGHPLEDSRVTVVVTDVANIMRQEQQAFDAVLLDVDNGPEGMTSKGNNWLYSEAGIKAAFAALHPGGVLAVWSAGADPAFVRRLGGAGFAVEEVQVRARGPAGGGRHTIWLARRPR